MAETKIAGIPWQQLAAGLVLFAILAVLFFESSAGQQAGAYVQTNGPSIVAILMFCVAAYLLFARSKTSVWADPREVIEASIKNGYLSEFAQDELTVQGIYGRNDPLPLRAIRIEPELAYLFIGRIISPGQQDAMMLTAIRGAAGKIVVHFEQVPTDKDISKMREKGLSAYFDAKLLVRETEKAFGEQAEEGALP